MRLGVCQFEGSNNILNNYKKIEKAINNAANKDVRFLQFQECALTGYPPIEVNTIDDIDFDLVNSCLNKIKLLAKKHNMFIAVGSIRLENNKYFNTIQLINPFGEIEGSYDKRALWGWDTNNFTEGTSDGIFKIDGYKIGIRICFEIRFAEYFRELLKQDVDICFVSFCDVLEEDSLERYNIIKSHLITRAVENIMPFVSVNSISNFQTAPTAVIDQNGSIVLEANKNEECLITYDFHKPKISFGAKGRLHYSKKLSK